LHLLSTWAKTALFIPISAFYLFVKKNTTAKCVKCLVAVANIHPSFLFKEIREMSSNLSSLNVYSASIKNELINCSPKTGLDTVIVLLIQ
jgi:hypothetical protein